MYYRPHVINFGLYQHYALERLVEFTSQGKLSSFNLKKSYNLNSPILKFCGYANKQTCVYRKEHSRIIYEKSYLI